jgi:diacylglycerol kinase family enzyme
MATRRTLIVNPNASNVTEERIAEAQARLRPVETFRTERRGHGVELAGEAAGDEVWVLGGDGLLNEALNGLRDGVALGIVAAGGTNVVARSLASRERRISVGRVNGRRFAFSAGIGVDSDVVRELETEQRYRSGKRASDFTYTRAVAARLWRGYEPRLEVVGMGRAAIVFVSNNAIYTYAGPVPLSFSPDARFELGLDLAAPQKIDRGSLALLLPRIAARRGLTGSRVLSGHDLDRIEVHCDVPLPLQADGEDLGDVREAVFEAERDAVTILV